MASGCGYGKYIEPIEHAHSCFQMTLGFPRVWVSSPQRGKTDDNSRSGSPVASPDSTLSRLGITAGLLSAIAVPGTSAISVQGTGLHGEDLRRTMMFSESVA